MIALVGPEGQPPVRPGAFCIRNRASPKVLPMSSRSSGGVSRLSPYLQVAPLALIMLAMVGIPIGTVILL